MKNLDLLVGVDKAQIQNTAVTNDEDWLDTDLSPSRPPCMFKIQVSVDAQTILSAMITRGGTEVRVHFNAGANLAADCLYVFELFVIDGDTINFQSDAAVTVNCFRVIERMA